MIILAFDTTSEHGGVAIYRDLERLGEAENQGNANYSVTLFEMTDRLLARLNLTLRDIDLFAVATGPGSFTGIRVGVAAAQGWAQAFERPVRGISVLEAMVEAARRETDWAVPLLDARRAEFYAAVFRRSPAEHPERLGDVRGAWGEAVALDTEGVAAAGRNAAEPHLILERNALPEFFQRLASGQRSTQTVCCLARECDAPAQSLRAILDAQVRWESVSGLLVGAMARLALLAAREGKLQSPAELDACYVRRSDAELHWRE